MNSLYYVIGILLCLASCDCQKLICDSKVINSSGTEDLQVNFTILNGDVQIFNPTRKTVLLIYGLPVFGESWGTEMGKKWMKLEPVNVITVGWETPEFLAGQFYVKTALSTEFFAFKIKEYIINLFGSHAKTVGFHFVGHSLGAHIAGQVARLLKKDGITVQRVTGLDPAHPCFENETASLRLRKSDARFVDVIHTNSDPGDNRGNFGSYNLMGHADFYPNGGNRQPECNKNTSQNSDYINNGINILVEMDNDILENFVGIDPKPFLINAVQKNSICNHNTAYKYFIESLSQNSTKRWASPTTWPLNVTKALNDQNKNCSDISCIEMGINARIPNDLGAVFYINMSDD